MLSISVRHLSFGKLKFCATYDQLSRTWRRIHASKHQKMESTVIDLTQEDALTRDFLSPAVEDKDVFETSDVEIDEIHKDTHRDRDEAVDVSELTDYNDSRAVFETTILENKNSDFSGRVDRYDMACYKGRVAVSYTHLDVYKRQPLGVDMNISFENVGGLDNYIDQLKEMVALPLLYPELYQNFNITPPRGVLFHGPPGTGKTLMARALAASCSTEQRKITFFMRKGADILSKWVGEAERQLRLLFEEAKKHQPSIIFFDEIDGLAPVRSSKQEQIHASIVSTMLALMDGMDNRGQVIVIGATNRPDAVDPALRLSLIHI